MNNDAVNMRNYIATICYNTVNVRNYIAIICYNSVKVRSNTDTEMLEVAHALKKTHKLIAIISMLLSLAKNQDP